MSLRGVLDVYLYIVVSPLIRGFLHICTHVHVLYMWPLAPEEYYVAYS
jgi:hypothetical protein